MKVLHLIHTTHVGGVEAAAAHLRVLCGAAADGRRGSPSGPIEYRIAAFAAAPVDRAALEADVAGGGLWSPAAWLRLLRLARADRDDLLITSLWRSAAVAATARLLGRRGRWAIWVHNTRYTHPVDRAVHHWCIPRADLVLCDSAAARDQLVSPVLEQSRALVPVQVVRPNAAPLPLDPAGPPGEAEPLHLVFWGRLAPQKRLERVLDLLLELQARRPGGARLSLVGPDGGDRERLRGLIDQRGLGGSVDLTGAADRTRLARIASAAHVFVQLSEFEGYAMSAHEALAAGMVSVLTPVGDLAADTTDGHDALHHHGDAARTAERLLALAADPAAWEGMARRARAVRSGSMLAEFSEAVAA